MSNIEKCPNCIKAAEEAYMQGYRDAMEIFREEIIKASRSMSKIDDYNKAKAKSDKMREFADRCESDNTDEFGATIEFKETWIGYYGDSSVNNWGDSIVEEIKKEIGFRLRGFASKAAERLEAETEEARLAARTEAQEILEDTK